MIKHHYVHNRHALLQLEQASAADRHRRWYMLADTVIGQKKEQIGFRPKHFYPNVHGKICNGRGKEIFASILDTEYNITLHTGTKWTDHEDTQKLSKQNHEEHMHRFLVSCTEKVVVPCKTKPNSLKRTSGNRPLSTSKSIAKFTRQKRQSSWYTLPLLTVYPEWVQLHGK